MPSSTGEPAAKADASYPPHSAMRYASPRFFPAQRFSAQVIRQKMLASIFCERRYALQYAT
jgi:hypothetical protein